MALTPGGTTEWQDIHVKLGNFAERKEEESDDKKEQRRVAAAENTVGIENYVSENHNADDENVLAQLRQRRLEEMKAASKTRHFGYIRSSTVLLCNAFLSNMFYLLRCQYFYEGMSRSCTFLIL